jgi:hypothetical protein
MHARDCRPSSKCVETPWAEFVGTPWAGFAGATQDTLALLADRPSRQIGTGDTGRPVDGRSTIDGAVVPTVIAAAGPVRRSR